MEVVKESDGTTDRAVELLGGCNEGNRRVDVVVRGHGTARSKSSAWRDSNGADIFLGIKFTAVVLTETSPTGSTFVFDARSSADGS